MARPRLIKPTLAEVQYVAFVLAEELMSFKEPIPPFETRYPEKLESCIQTPFQTFNSKSLYPTFLGKSAILFYLLIKNHPFQNGNKRIAVVTLIFFLISNSWVLRVRNRELYEFAKSVAASSAKDKDKVLVLIHQFLADNSRKLK